MTDERRRPIDWDVDESPTSPTSATSSVAIRADGAIPVGCHARPWGSCNASRPTPSILLVRVVGNWSWSVAVP